MYSFIKNPVRKSEKRDDMESYNETMSVYYQWWSICIPIRERELNAKVN